jgi:hypothetical protein
VVEELGTLTVQAEDPIRYIVTIAETPPEVGLPVEQLLGWVHFYWRKARVFRALAAGNRRAAVALAAEMILRHPVKTLEYYVRRNRK